MAGTSNPNPSTVSPYSTGGGGVVLEHAYGAAALASLLLGESVAGLGTGFSVTKVAFQARHTSEIDDLVIMGSSADGVEQQLGVGVRRNPTIGASDTDFVALVANMLRLLTHRAAEVENGAWRIGLAVAGPHSGAALLAELTDHARRQHSAEEFRRAVGQTRRQLRNQLERFDQVVEAAWREVADAPGAEDLTWRLLNGLFVIETRLEGDLAADHAALIARLGALCDGSTTPSNLWAELYRLASVYVPAGATVDEALLRRDLLGKVNVRRSSRRAEAWTILDALGDEFQLVRQALGDDGQALKLDRQAIRQRVRAAIRPGAVVLVKGAPDTGKSAIVVATASELMSDGAATVSLNLRDAPATLVEFVHQLGASVDEVVAGMAVADLRAVIVDGAEAVLEGRGPLLRAMASAARRANAALVVVTRDDAAVAIERVLLDGVSQPDQVTVSRVEVDGLSDEEVEEVVGTFPKLQSLGADARAAWLLRRPGLVDLLLRADAVHSLPAGPVVEADVLAAVWVDLVRNGEAAASHGATPDGREQSLLALASDRLRQSTHPVALDGSALMSLRSDHLLRRVRPTVGDDFHNDLIRDFAVAALLDRRGFSLIREAEAPRWAVRAVTLACQVRLISSDDVERVRRELQADFDSLAGEYGERWSDVVTEAYLAPRISDGALGAAWPALLADGGRELRRFIRILLARHAPLAALDPAVATPFVRLLIDHYDELAGLPADVREQIGELLDAWLSGLAARAENDQPDLLRERVRDLLLARHLLDEDRARGDDHHLERLAMLGPDGDERVVAHLRQAARQEPADLDRCVEEPYARLALAVHHPALLLALAEAYYIEEEDDADPDGHFFGRSLRYGDGIRHHRFRGIRATRVASYLGPFAQLLRVMPIPTIAFINRLLNRAAAERVATLADLGEGSEQYGLLMSICGIDSRRYIGDGHVWGWYRGGTVGPEAASSALMALEAWADEMIASGVPVRRLATILLDGAHNLAMPGLLYGLLVRHLDHVGDELEGFLAEPTVWHLEFGRVTNESSFLVRSDPPDVAGGQRRGYSPRDLAAELVATGRLAGDSKRLDRLRVVADKLDQAAAEREGSPEIRSWAAALRWENYQASTTESGVAISFEAPIDIAAQMADQRADLDRGMIGWQLLQHYASHDDLGFPDLSQLEVDLTAARAYAERPPESGPLESAGPPAAVAATTLRAHAAGMVAVPDSDLRWSLGFLVDTVSGATRETHYSDGAVFRWGSDRSAALSLPATLLPDFHENASPTLAGAWDRDAVLGALMRLTTSPTDEVRRMTAVALAPVWAAPCSVLAGGEECRHSVAMALTLEGIRYSRLGPHDSSGYRQPLPLAEPALDALPGVAPGDLMLDWLTGPIIAAAGCAHSGCCVADVAVDALTKLLAAERRVLPHYIEKHYRRDDADREPVAAAMLAEAAAGRREALDTFLQELRIHPESLGELLEDMMRVATYDEARRADLAVMWPTIMNSLLDAADAGIALRGDRYLDDRPLAAVVPVPRPTTIDSDIDGRIQSAAAGWPTIGQLSPHLDRWLGHAVGSAHCVDSLVGFLRLHDAETQVDPGLRWVRQLVDGHAAAVASRSYLLTEWLEMLRASRRIPAKWKGMYQVLVDALAAAGDGRAQRLQAAEE